ncbi:MAG: Rne/Rng family ribonuclease [Syntrophobacterales bacterium]|nr:Rne/Rng family ribonuclease [Syntrophobacterales bacterium]
MKKIMLINAIDREEQRMAIVENGKLVEFNLQMAEHEPITGNIYKGIVQKVERGLQAAFVDYGGKKNGFLPLHDVSPDYYKSEGADGEGHKRHGLKSGQELLVQVVREEKDRKGAMLTTYISLPGRYLVYLPNREGAGVSRKIEDEAERKKLKEFVDQVLKKDEKAGFIVRTAGQSRKKQELLRDYQHLHRLWKEITKKAAQVSAPALIYQESDFGVRSLRDYFTPDISEILIDDPDTFKKVRDYCKIVQPRNVKMIKLYKEHTPLFEKYQLEKQTDEIYQERVTLKSGGSIVITPTEAMITIDVNSGRGSNRKDVEETAFRTNLEAVEVIARQLRLRDLGGLIVVDFIDMRERKHISEVEKAFKKALSLDRARIQMSRISKFGIMELSRQKKQSAIQDISYTTCPQCKGSGLRPSLEYIALGIYRKIKAEVVRGDTASIKVTLPWEVSDYLLNQKRAELTNLEKTYETNIHVSGSADMHWGESKFEKVRKPEAEKELQPEVVQPEEHTASPPEEETVKEAVPEGEEGQAVAAESTEPTKKKPARRRPRRRRRKTAEQTAGQPSESAVAPEGKADEEKEVVEEKKKDKSILEKLFFSL